jgi:hypothetical protein
MKSLTIIQNQSLLDVAIEQLGSVDRAFEVALLNGLSISADLYPGQEINLPDVYSANTEQALYFANKKIATAQAFAQTEELSPILEGIGYMEVEYDFKVQ